MERELERRYWRCQAVTTRRKRQKRKNPNEIGDGLIASHSNGHKVGLLKMLKK